MFRLPRPRWTYSSARLLGFLSAFDPTGQYLSRALAGDSAEREQARSPAVPAGAFEFAGAVASLQHAVERMERRDQETLRVLDQVREQLEGGIRRQHIPVPRQKQGDGEAIPSQRTPGWSEEEHDR